MQNEKLVWLRLDEIENAIDNLEMVDFFLERIENEKKWKWIVISAHMALYGFAICAANNPPYQSVIDYGENKQEGRLISLKEALEKLKKPIHDKSPNDYYKLLELSSSQEDAIKKLSKEFRNHFEHFRPLHWSIVVSGFPKMILEIIEVIRFIAVDSHRVNTSIKDENRITNVIEKIEIAIKQHT